MNADAPEPVQRSLLAWIIESLGVYYTIFLLLAALLSFVFALILVIRGKGPMAATALILIVHTPLLIGLFAGFRGAMASFVIVAMSSSTPRPSTLAEGFSTALIAPMVALWLMVPGYLTAMVGATIRALTASRENSSTESGTETR